jgi:hypothetical protein
MMPTILRGKGDVVEGKVIIFIVRKLEGPRLIRKSGSHRGQWGKLYDGMAFIDRPIHV